LLAAFGLLCKEHPDRRGMSDSKIETVKETARRSLCDLNFSPQKKRCSASVSACVGEVKNFSPSFSLLLRRLRGNFSSHKLAHVSPRSAHFFLENLLLGALNSIKKIFSFCNSFLSSRPPQIKVLSARTRSSERKVLSVPRSRAKKKKRELLQ
jgi:hypothetical protein